MLHRRIAIDKWTYICENVLEANALGLEYKAWYRCQPGEYALTDNGWVVELLNIVDYPPKPGNTRHIKAFDFYNLRHFVRLVEGELLVSKATLEYNPKDRARALSPNAKMVLSLLDQNINLQQAIMMCYSPMFRTQAAERLLNSPRFIEKLKQTKAYMNIKEEFMNAGITPAVLASKVKESINSSNFKEKQWAVDLALEYLTKTDKNQLSVNITNIQTTPELQEGIDALMSHKVPRILPERIDEAVVVDS